MLKNKIIVRKIRNILILLMVIIIMFGAYKNIRDSRAENVKDITIEILDKDGALSAQTLTTNAIELEEGIYRVDLPRTLNGISITEYYKKDGQQLEVNNANSGMILELTEEELGNDSEIQIQIDTAYDKKEVKADGETKVLYNRQVQYDENVIVLGYMPLDAQLEVKEVDIGTLTNVKLPSQEQTIKSAYDISVYELIEKTIVKEGAEKENAQAQAQTEIESESETEAEGEAQTKTETQAETQTNATETDTNNTETNAAAGIVIEEGTETDTEETQQQQEQTEETTSQEETSGQETELTQTTQEETSNEKAQTTETQEETITEKIEYEPAKYGEELYVRIIYNREDQDKEKISIYNTNNEQLEVVQEAEGAGFLTTKLETFVVATEIREEGLIEEVPEEEVPEEETPGEGEGNEGSTGGSGLGGIIDGSIGDTGGLDEELLGASSGTPYLPSGYTYVTGTKSTGVVIKDASGNEFVWVEVPKTSTVYPTAGTSITSFTTANYTKIETDLKTYTSTIRNSTAFSDIYHSDASTGLTSSEYTTLKQQMLKSIYLNGGFYVGRYETGATSARTSSTSGTSQAAVIKANMYPYTRVTTSEAQTKAEGFASGSMKSSLLFGLQWDLVLKHLQTKGAATQAQVTTNSKAWGNHIDSTWTVSNTSAKYSTDSDHNTWKTGAYTKTSTTTSVKLSTGAADTFKKMNIYDLAGNNWEWTLEYANSSTYPVTLRGGSSHLPGGEKNVSYRGREETTTKGTSVGFRVGLFYNGDASSTKMTAPTLSVSPTSTDYAKAAKSVTITANATGGGGLSSSNSYQYYLSNSSTALSGGAWTTYTSGTAFNINPGTSGTYYLFVKRINNLIGTASTSGGTATTVSGTTYQRFGPYKFDYTAPTYTSVEVKNVTKDGYDVYVYGVADAHSGVSAVKYPTWTVNGDQDDLLWITATDQGNGTYYCRVNASDHNNEEGWYHTSVYLYDALSTSAGIDDISNVYVDRTAPQISISPSNGNQTWAKSHSATISLTDNYSGFASGETLNYGWSTSATEPPAIWTAITPTASSTSQTFTATASDLNGKYYLWVDPMNETYKDAQENVQTTTVKSTGAFYFDNTVPAVTYKYASTDIDYDAKNVKIVFDITDNNYSTTSLALSDLTIRIDGEDITNNSEVRKAFTSVAVAGTVDGVSKTIGRRYTLTLSELEQSSIDAGEKYLDYSGVISITIAGGKVSDSASNTNTTKTITVGINEAQQLPSSQSTDPYLPNGYKHVQGTLASGIVIEDGAGNQFVWVEVPRTSTVYPTAGLDIKSFTDEEYTKIENDLKTYTSVYRNNLGGTTSTANKDEYHSDSLTGLTETEYNNQKKKMLKSVYKNGGFYVGRYEVGTEDGARTSSSNATQTPVIKANVYPYNYITTSDAQQLSESFATSGNTTSLMFGVQWDLMLKYLETKGTAQSQLTSDSTSWGNYMNNTVAITNENAKNYTSANGWKTGTYLNNTTTVSVLLSPGASNTFYKQNISDIAGNMYEWTLEYDDSSNPAVGRGGHYSMDGNERPAIMRGAWTISDSKKAHVGFRVSLYKDESMTTGENAPSYIPERFSHVEGSLNTGYVVQDPAGNEYVWVEVPKTSTVYPTAGLNIKEFTDDEYTAIETDLHTYTSVYRNGTQFEDEYLDFEAAGLYLQGLTREEFYTQKKKMLKSIYQYGGFYVGRYETGTTTPITSAEDKTKTPVIKANMYPYNKISVAGAQAV